MAWSRSSASGSELPWPRRFYRATAKVFVLSAGQVDSDRLSAFADNMNAQLRHAIETETTRKSFRSAIHLEMRGHQATDKGVEIRAEPAAPHHSVVCVIYESITMSTPGSPRNSAPSCSSLQAATRTKPSRVTTI
jgi:hypothetical protein